MSKKPNWITLDYLEIYCRNHHLVIGCRDLDNEIWISPTGSHPSDLTSAEVRELLQSCNRFELRTLLGGEDDENEQFSVPESSILNRDELSLRLSRLLN